LQPPNSTICKVRHLRSVNQWEHNDTIAALPIDMPEREMIERTDVLLIPHLAKSCYALLREYAHYERYDEAYRLGVTWIIHLDDKNSDDVATSIQAQMVLKSDDDHEGWKLPGHAVTPFRALSASARSAEGTPIVDPNYGCAGYYATHSRYIYRPCRSKGRRRNIIGTTSSKTRSNLAKRR
jgi:hypothetical protein